jgi:hypothetical protein
MTFALAMVTPRLAFVAADRRYSGAAGIKNFEGTKLVRLDTSDGHGVITYAGVGARVASRPFEISEWIEKVLRGSNRTLDQSLRVIAEASFEQRLHQLADGHTFAYAGYIQVFLLDGFTVSRQATFARLNYCVIIVSMNKQDTVLTRKRRGPAPTGKGTLVGVRLQPDMLAGVDQFIAEHDGMSRPEGVRLIIRDWLAKNQVLRAE